MLPWERDSELKCLIVTCAWVWDWPNLNSVYAKNVVAKIMDLLLSALSAAAGKILSWEFFLSIV